MFKKVIIYFYHKRIFKVFKFILKTIVSEKGYNFIKNRIKQKLLPEKNSIKRDAFQYPNTEKKFGINIAGYLSSGLGLGEAARNLVKAIKTQDIPFALNNYEISKDRNNNNQYSDLFKTENPYFFNLINVNPDHFDFFYLKGKEDYFKNKYNIGMWYWELSNFPDEWIKYFVFFNEIWVATDFILNAISFYSPIPVIKIPPVIELEYDQSIGREYFEIPEGIFVFLFTFDFYSTMMRKNPIGLISAFKMAFGNDDKAMLIIKSSNGKYFKRDFHTLTKEINGFKNIKLIDSYLERKVLNSLINASDCYTSLHRSEGFGLGIAEAMYLGKPVIVTGYSGNMDFNNINNSFLVRYELSVLDQDYGLYKKGNIWAEPDIEHAAQLMRTVFENRDYSSKIAKEGMEFIKTNYSPEIVGKKIKQRMNII
jgi:glycosyltransferase involved in cell wall biosynthesis